MKSILSALGGKATLVIIVVAVVGGGVVIVPKLTGSDLESVARKYITEQHESSVIPYKDLDVQVVKNDGTRAIVKHTLSRQYECRAYVESKIKYEVGPGGEFEPIFDHNREKLKEAGVPSFTTVEIAQLRAMGVLSKSYDYQEEQDVRKRWKRCVFIGEYAKTGNKWAWSSGISGYALLSPKEQEKLGYKATDEEVQKLLPSSTPTPQPVQQNQQFSSSGQMIVDAELEGRKLKLLVANTDVEKMQGLRGRRDLTEADGMAFNYSRQTVEITNEYTYLDLDVYWMQGNDIAGKDFLPSFEKDGKKTLKSPVPIDAVILVVKR